MRFPALVQHHDLPFELNLFTFVSKLKIMHFQSTMIQFSYLWANLMRARTCLRLINGFLCCICTPNLAFLKARHTMTSINNKFVSHSSCFVVANAVPSRPLVIRGTQHLFSWSIETWVCVQHTQFCSYMYLYNNWSFSWAFKLEL